MALLFVSNEDGFNFLIKSDGILRIALDMLNGESIDHGQILDGSLSLLLFFGFLSLITSVVKFFRIPPF